METKDLCINRTIYVYSFEKMEVYECIISKTFKYGNSIRLVSKYSKSNGDNKEFVLSLSNGLDTKLNDIEGNERIIGHINKSLLKEQVLLSYKNCINIIADKMIVLNKKFEL